MEAETVEFYTALGYPESPQARSKCFSAKAIYMNLLQFLREILRKEID